MSNTRKYTVPVRVGNLSGDPAETDTGTLYFDTTLDVLKFRNSTDYKSVLGQVQDDPAPVLGGALNVNNFPIINPAGDVVLAPAAVIKRATYAAPGNFVEEEYIHAIPLDASMTDVIITTLAIDPSIHEMMEVTYKMKDSAGEIRGGSVFLVSNGATVSVFDGPTVETGIITISFSGGLLLVGNVPATFTGQVTGMTTDVTIDADNNGIIGNSVILTFNGVDDVNDAILTWNTANPSNTVTLSSGIGTQVPDNGTSIQLGGGNDGTILAALTYTSGTESAVVRADVKRFLA